MIPFDATSNLPAPLPQVTLSVPATHQRGPGETSAPPPGEAVRFIALSDEGKSGLHFPLFERAPATPLKMTLPLLLPNDIRLNLLPFGAPITRPVSPAPKTARKAPRVDTSMSVYVDAQQTAANLSTQQSFDASVGVGGSFRQVFRPWAGYAVNLGYTRTVEHNGYIKNGQYAVIDIPSHRYETTVSYVAQKHVTPKLSGFVSAGAGATTFLPTHRGNNALNYANTPVYAPPVNFRPTGVFGIGADFHLTPRLSMRAEYRGLVYKAPDYGENFGRPIVISNQPTLGVAYHFGRGK